MNVFNTFLTFSLGKFNPFRSFIYYSLVDRDIFFFEKPGENEVIITGLPPFQLDERVPSFVVYPVLLNRDFMQIQTINHGLPEIVDQNTNTVTVLSVLTFTRPHSSDKNVSVLASFLNKSGNIEYIQQNKPRFEYGEIRTNILSSSNFIPSNPTVIGSEMMGDDGIPLKMLVKETVSGAGIGFVAYNWNPYITHTRPFFGWENMRGPLGKLTITNDIPDALKDSTTTSQYFILSACSNNGPDYVARNSIMQIEGMSSGNDKIPFNYGVKNFWQLGFSANEALQGLSPVLGWKRYSVTFPVTYWAQRQGSPRGWVESDMLQYDKWDQRHSSLPYPGKYESFRNNWWGWRDMWRVFLHRNNNATLGTWRYWGPQLEFGLSATPFTDQGPQVLSGSRNVKNILPGLSSVALNLNRDYWYGRWERWPAITSNIDTPYGNSSINPSYQFTTTAGQWGTYLDIHTARHLLPPPQFIPNNNLLYNTDFGGGEIGDIISINSTGFMLGWRPWNDPAGDRLGRMPYGWFVYPANVASDQQATSFRDTTFRIVSTGQINGANFIDIRFNGRTTSADSIVFVADFGLGRAQVYQAHLIPTVNTAFVTSLCCQRVGGSWPGTPSITLNVRQYGPNNTSSANNLFNITTKSTSSQTYTDTNTSFNTLTCISLSALTVSLANTQDVWFQTNSIPANTTFDFTLRLCGLKQELGYSPTPYTPTPTLIHTLSTMTFSIYAKKVDGGANPTYWTGHWQDGNGGIMQRIGLLNELRPRNNVLITNTIWVKIDGPGIPDSAQLGFNFGSQEWRYKRFYATKTWKRFIFQTVYNRDQYYDPGRVDGQGYAFWLDQRDGDNLGFDANTTRVYIAGCQCEISPIPTQFIPSPQNSIGVDTNYSGLLIEPERSNLALFSSVYNNISATNNSPNANISYTTRTAPDNSTQTAQLSTNNNIRTTFLYLTGCNVGKIQTRYTISMFVKPLHPATVLQFAMHPSHQGSAISFNYDALSDRILNLRKSNSTDTADAEQYIDEWKRVTFTTLCSANSGRIWPGIAITSNTPANRCLVWGLQIEEGSTPSSYIPVSGFVGVRGTDYLAISGEDLWSLYNKVLPGTQVTLSKGSFYFESQQKYISQSPQLLFRIEGRDKVKYNAISFTTTSTRRISSSILNNSIFIDIPTSWVNTSIKTIFSYNNIIDQFYLGSSGVAISGTQTNNIGLSVFEFSGFNNTAYLKKLIVFPDQIPLADIKTLTT